MEQRTYKNTDISVSLLGMGMMRLPKISPDKEDIDEKAAEAMIVVPDNTEVLMPMGQQAYQPVLKLVGVLIFVHQYVFEQVLIMLQHVRILFKKLHRQKDNIVKIHRVGGFEPFLVLLVNSCNCFQPEIRFRFC